MYKLNFYVPVADVETVKMALFEKGAGKTGDYDCCSWQVLGKGQFRPLKGAKPFIGVQNKLEKVAEYKVEMVVDDALITEAVKVLIDIHPYEEPAYEFYPINK